MLAQGVWRPFEPEDPRLAPVRDLWARQSCWDYSAQTDRLQARLQARGEEVFVSPLESLYDEGRLQTGTSWAQGVTALLPRADVVGLVADAGDSLVRRWDDIEAVCGPLPVEPELYPARYRAASWPDAEQWTRLAAREPVAWLQPD